MFTPAFDKRHADPKKNYGIGAVQVGFYLMGEMGTIQFKFMTDWFLPETHVGYRSELTNHKPWGTDIGYHSRKPVYDDQPLMTDDCPHLLNGGPCYYDGSSLNAEPIAQLLVEQGSDAVWKLMEQRYLDQFGELR